MCASTERICAGQGEALNETSMKRANRARAERNEIQEESARRGNLAVGQADKPLRDFSLALLSSIDVDSKLWRRKALGGALGSISLSLSLLRPPHLDSPFLIVRATRETPRAILRFLRADLPIRQIHKLSRFRRGCGPPAVFFFFFSGVCEIT